MYHARQHYALAAAVKIDSFAYLPMQDFAFSTFIAQNFGTDNRERIRLGTRRSSAAMPSGPPSLSAGSSWTSRDAVTSKESAGNPHKNEKREGISSGCSLFLFAV